MAITRALSVGFRLSSRDVWREVRSARLLWLWVAVGIPAAGFSANNSWIGAGLAVGNLGLAWGWACIIRRFTGDRPEAVPVRRPRLEIGIGFAFWVTSLVLIAAFFGLIVSQPVHRWIHGIAGWASDLGVAAQRAGLPNYLALRLPNMVVLTVITTVPVLLIFLALGYRARGMGLRAFDWRLPLALIAVSWLIGLPFGFSMGPIVQALEESAVILVIAAFPEELFFRAYLIPRLSAVMRHPIDAVVIAALVFNLSHVPVVMFEGSSFFEATVSRIALDYPSGLVWGYLYLRTRSIWPGVAWHATTANVGNLFFT